MSRSIMRGIVWSVATAVLMSAFPAQALAAPKPVEGGRELPQLHQPKAVQVSTVKTGRGKRADDATAHAWREPTVTWPKAGTAEVALVDGSAGGVQAGELPVRVAPAGGVARATDTGSGARFHVTVEDRAAADAAGAQGALVSLKRADGAKIKQPLDVTVDYSAYRNAFGGDFAARLRLVQLPTCALNEPAAKGCGRGRPLVTRNDTKTGSLTATVTPTAATAVNALGVPQAEAVVLAVTAGAEGASGSFKATSQQPSGNWSAGGSAGAFTWGYPIGVPDVPGELTPDVTLGYSSQAVDGRTAASNNQPSWIGDGWDWQPGHIERRYKPCNDDKDKSGATNATKVGDMCWFNDNAVLSLNGKTTELVYEAAKGWHPAADSGEKVEKLTGAANGDEGTSGVDGTGEHWKITTTDGTQYFFGRNRLPNWSNHGTEADDPETNSTLTMPVFGNHPGEPCYNASFASGWCQQAYRWELDYVVDPRGNAMAYYWTKDTNYYGRNVNETTGASTNTPYIRSAYLSRIDYGLRDSSVYTAKAMGQVHFGVSERCLTDCNTFDTNHAANWPDTPQDQMCAKDAECKDKYSPSFWSRKRLTSITTKVLTVGAYKDVDSWNLSQGFPESGDGISTPMWLQSITRTGMAGGTLGLPAVTFSGEQMANRVDKTGDGLAPFVRLRLNQIINETGGGIGVNYSLPECTAATLPPTDATNTTRCYPVKWAFEGETAKTDWFNSYVVSEVIESDNLADTPDTSTKYTYLGGAEWAKSEDEFTKAADRTYSMGRGYGRVQTRKGAGLDPTTLTEARYFRGMDGAAVADSAGVSVTDRPQFIGMLREQASYNGATTALISATSYTPWRSSAVATRVRKTTWDTTLPDAVSYQIGVQKEQTRTAVTGGERKTSLTRTFDSYGLVDTVSKTGDEAKTGDESCTTTTYVRNTTTNLVSLPSRIEEVAVTCGATVSRPGDVNSDVRTYYDDATSLTTAPTKGLATKGEQINGGGTGYDTVSTTAAADYDAYGRPLKTTDTYGKVTTTDFTPTTGEAPTVRTETNAKGHIVTTTLDAERGQAIQVKDANNRLSTSEYDPLGRVTKGWTAAHTAAAYPTRPSYTFSYQIRRDGPMVVTTNVLNHADIYQPSYAFHDGLLRTVATQKPAPDGAGRLATRTLYDSRGLPWHNSGTFFATGAAEPVMVTGQELNYPSATETLYDRAGRTTAQIARRFGDETKRTTLSYTGDSTTVIPPDGGTATKTVIDALGRKVEAQEYTNAAHTAAQSTLFNYDKHGRLAKIEDASGAQWLYTYDARGRLTGTTDPDKGTSTTVYDAGDRVTDVTDMRGVTLHTDYDELGRSTKVSQGAAVRAEWTYDTATGGKGQPATATRYDGTDAYTTKVSAYSTLYKPSITEVTIPATTANGALAGTYKWTTAYHHTGQVKWMRNPTIGGLPQDEQVDLAYTEAGLPTTMYAGTDALVSATTYDHYGRTIRDQMGEFGKQLITSNIYDEHTGLLTQTTSDRDTAPQRVIDTGYDYDPAGNITEVTTGTGQDATRKVDTQCFDTDELRRITQAWTATGSCTAAPSASTVGGSDAYWTTYSYDAIGNRKTETQHTTPSGPTGDITRTYTTPAAGTHKLPSVTTTGPAGTAQDTYTYDATGNIKTRVLGGDTQTLAWDAEGHLASTSQGTKNTSYLYDTGGQRLIRRDSTGTTLYLPDGSEATLKNGTVTATRYYTFNGNTIAMRQGAKLTYLLADHHGTTTTQIDALTQATTQRRSHIFGAPRGTQPTNWSGDKGFVGGTSDSDTGLTHIGAREYDPAIGRFISVDPIMDMADSQQMHGYSYANNNPVTQSDPDGLRPIGLCEGYGGCGGKAEDDGWEQTTEWFTSSGSGTWTQHTMKRESDIRDDASVVWSYTYTEGAEKIVRYETYKNGQSVPFKAPEGEHYLLTKLKSAAKFLIFDPQDCAEMVSWSCVAAVASTIPAAKLAKVMKLKRVEKVDSLSTPCAPKHSFVPGTDVLLADGTKKDIEDVELGDKVVATDPETGKTSIREVGGTISTEDDKEFVDLTITTKDGDAALISTTTHPFWVESEDEWIDAGSLEPGMRLRTPDGDTVQLKDARHFQKRQRTHDLTITDIHTYYVLAGATPVLVHNDDKNLCRLLGISQQTLNRLVGDAYRDHIADFYRQRGMNVITDATNPGPLTFPTPWGDRIYDIGILDSNGNVAHYIETKSGNAGKVALQMKKDAYIGQRYGVRANYVFDGD
ncbi:polymorphic toxin-type HINT domain-containing protein [Streptomyces sp. NPDC050149]|uniref:polymorphic toxin-type HINT domain-containing protein n=1 Tax=Streptomyces sp. NPDC050149 TaxID=3365603 RepID=UPI0037A21C63